MDELKLQVSQMKQVLAVANEEDKPGLEKMIDELEKLLQFEGLTSTEDDVNEGQNELGSYSENSSGYAQCADDDDDEDEEFRRFQEEIAAFDKPSSSTTSCSASNECSENNISSASISSPNTSTNGTVKDELLQLEGMLCRAPYIHHWGQVGYYNAIVLNVENASSKCESLDTIFVRVVFSQPIADSMKPCSYFMEGHCRYDEESCKYSHGEVVSLADLKEYKEADFLKIVAKSRVLAKYSDGLWYNATVSEIQEGGSIIVKYDSYPESVTVPLHDLFPLHNDETEDSYNSDISYDSSSDSDDETGDSNVINIDNLPLFNMKASDRLGAWEQHTKGIGSKLMAQMGYIIGQGLGKNGEGRIEPVDAVVLPQGLSLDTCMEIKEKAGDENLFSVQKKLERLQKREARRAKKQEGKEQKPKAHESMFNFLNTKLTLAKDNKKPKVNHVNIKELSKETCKNLNKKALNLNENIKQVNKDMIKLKDSLKRNEGRDKATVERMKSKLDTLEHQLKELRKSETVIESEQRQRNDKKKLSIF